MKLTKDLFELFTNDYDDRRSLNRIAKKGLYAIATNGHILIRVNENDLDFTPETVDDFPESAATIIDEYKELIKGTKPDRIKVADLKQTLSTVPKEKINKTIECSSCNGEGIEYCTCCQHENDCSYCGGSGEMITDQVLGHEYSYVHNVRIDAHYYKAKVLQIIVDAAHKLNQNKLFWYSLPENTSKNPGALIFLPKVDILVMSVMMNHDRTKDEQDEYIHIVEIPEPSATD